MHPLRQVWEYNSFILGGIPEWIHLCYNSPINMHMQLKLYSIRQL